MKMPKIVSNTIQLHIAAKSGNDYKFLVLQRSENVLIYPGLWQVVTGTIEDGETALQTAEREIIEETQLKPSRMYTIPYIASFFDTDKDQIHLSPVFGAVVDISETIILSNEHQEYLWLEYNDCIAKLELPSHKEGTRIFKKYILKKLKALS